MGVARIAEQGLHFGRAEIERIDSDNSRAVLIHGNLIHSLALPAEFDSDDLCRQRHKLTDAVLHASGNDEVLWFLLLQLRHCIST